jgi:CheY-like chemotaxis protein
MDSQGAGTSQQGRPRILVVDDEPSILSVIRRLLRDTCEVFVAGSPVEALELAAGGASFDAVLCDVCMPEMTGAEFKAAVKRISPSLADRFVWMTGDASGVTGLSLPKPFTQREALGVIEKVVSSFRLQAACS